MRIKSIEIQNFRAFPGPATYTFKLDGKNLLLYGENGSGKSSLVRALDELFNLEPTAADFDVFENVFARRTSPGGYAKVECDDNSVYEWRGNLRPTGPASIDISRRRAILDYRSLLRTNYGGQGLEERLFKLAVEVLLTHVEIPTTGQLQTIGQLWQDVLDILPNRGQRHTPQRLSIIANAIAEFDNALTSALERIKARVAGILNYFEGHHIEVEFDYAGLQYDRTARQLLPGKLAVKISFRGEVLTDWSGFLNEARLSALALSMYLGATLERNPAAPPGAPVPLKLLVMDDVLIGLDMSNRLPILSILEDEMFADYQVVLSTHDHVWYDMARRRTENSGLWTYVQMYDDLSPDRSHSIPVINDGQNLLATARRHLISHDLKAAAVYARSAFEQKLVKYCEDQSIAVPYSAEQRNTDTEKLIFAIERRLRSDGRYALVMAQLERVKLYRSLVLNSLSHAPISTLVRAEVEAAIAAVAGLQLKRASDVDICAEVNTLLNKPVGLSPSERVYVSCCLHTLFATSLQEFCVRRRVKVEFRSNWTGLTRRELWEAAKPMLASGTISGTGTFVTDIEQHTALLVAEPNLVTFRQYTTNDLQTVFNILTTLTTATTSPATYRGKLSEWAELP
jgi:energy-coupling factor transporter ATP-binding protein EcfA2